MPLAFTTGTSSHPKNTLQKRKFKIKVFVLLHVLIPGVMLSSLKTVNPWLSACDLAQPAQPEMQRSCSAMHLPRATSPQRDGTMSCPKPCANDTDNQTQCLRYLNQHLKNAICGMDRSNQEGIKWIIRLMEGIHFPHCCEFRVMDTLSTALERRVLKGGHECAEVMDSLEDVDNLAARASCEFSDVLSRFDCGQPYSVRFSCEDCKEAYRFWVCSSLLPYFKEKKRIRPCRSICQSVEQKCPYFLPENMAPTLPTQYAGEPTFLCMDPNIPETGEQLERSLYPEKDRCCYKVCRNESGDHLCSENCHSYEELISYDAAMNQSVSCSASDLSSRTSNMTCSTAPPVGSGCPPTMPKPLTLILSTCLGYPVANRVHLLPLLVLFTYYLLPLQVIKLIICIYFLSVDYYRISPLFICLKKKIKLFFQLVKLSNLIFNYFKFNSNKWQYYFILISVNLLFSLCNKNPKPLTTPSCLINELVIKKSEVTRGTRHYYKHYFPILSNIAQKLKEIVLNSRKICGSTKWKPLKLMSVNLVIETITSHEKCIRIKENSLTTNRIKIYSIILKVLLIKDSHYRLIWQKPFKEKMPETTNWLSNVSSKCIRYFTIRLIINSVPRTNVVEKSICMFLHSLRSYNYVWYYIIKSNINKIYSKKYCKRRSIPVNLKKTNRRTRLVKTCRSIRLTMREKR